MSKEFKIKNTKVMLDCPEKMSERVIVLIPGVSGGALTNKYKELVSKSLEAGYSISRMQSWDNVMSLEEKTVKIIHDEITDVVNFLKDKGYKEINFIGKSFGGTMLLLYRNKAIDSMVLWSPVIDVADKDNVESIFNISFGKISKLTDIKLSKIYLNNLAVPIRIIHGAADNVVPLSNSQKIVEMLPNAKLFPINGAGHSYENLVQKNQILDATIDFFKNNKFK